jgi:hypothetical protein
MTVFSPITALYTVSGFINDVEGGKYGIYSHAEGHQGITTAREECKENGGVIDVALRGQCQKSNRQTETLDTRVMRSRAWSARS